MPIHSENLKHNRKEYRLTLQDCCFRLSLIVNGERETVATGFFGKEGIRSIEGDIDEGLKRKIVTILKAGFQYSMRKKQAPRGSKKKAEEGVQARKASPRIPRSITPVNSASI